MRHGSRLTESADETQGRVAGALFLIGSAMTFVGILLPHSSKADVNGFWLIATATAVVAALLLRFSRPLSTGTYPWIMLGASLVVTLSIYFNGERHGGASAGNQVLYLWIALYSGYFFSVVGVVVELGAIAGLYGGVLSVIHPGPVALTRWLVTVGMVAAAAGIVHILKRRNDGLVARLSIAARTDSLTGLVNRQGFDECLELELSRGRRTGLPTALIIADIDHFKSINDRLGHAAGDAALRAVGRTALRAARGTDVVARIGGDEFAAILPDTDAEGAFLFAERLREAISESAWADEVPLTMSLGIAESEVDGLRPEDLTHSADQALYLAKELGRNQTVVAPGAREAVRTRATRRLALARDDRDVVSQHR